MEPESLTLAGWLGVGAVFLFAGLVHGILGLGFPMLATPLLAIAFDIRIAILMTLLPTVTVNVISILRGGRWSESIGRHWPLVIMIPAGTVAGSWLLISVDPAPFRLLLAAIILSYLFKDRLTALNLDWIKSHRVMAYLIFGVAAGFTAGTVNVMVPLLIIVALQVGMTPLVMVQVFNLCFLAGKTVQMGVFGYSGIMTSSLLLFTLPFAALSAVALFGGMRMRERVDAETYRKYLHRVLVVMVFVLTGQYLLELVS